MTCKGSIRCCSLHVVLFIFSLCCSSCARLSAAADTLSSGQSLAGDQTLVSKGGIFELGFFKPGNSSKYYIGIWYKDRAKKTTVWVANREKPVANASLSELRIIDDGNLAILNQHKIRIWSSNQTSTTSDSTIAVLLDTGNLVLVDGSNSSILYWQSFDHPTDSWLPGQRLGWNKLSHRYMAITSWSSPEDPAPGPYSFGVDPTGRDQVVMQWNGVETYFSSGEWNGRYFTSVPELEAGQFYTFTYFPSERYITYTFVYPESGSVTRFVAEVSGEGKMWAWQNRLNGNAFWNLFWSQPREECQVYSLCGPFSICTENGAPVCRCLKGFEPTSEADWHSGLWGSGCERKTKLQCGNNSVGGEKDKFLLMPNVQPPTKPETLPVRSDEECESACLNNCSCTAYAYSGVLCSTWNGDLRNIKTSDNDSIVESTSLYLKLAATELPDSEPWKSDEGSKKGIIIGAVGGSVVLLVLVLVLTYTWQRKRLIRVSEKVEEGSLVVFQYRDLQGMTKNFSDRLGGGGFGSVFRGVLPNSSPIAVKKLERIKQGEKQFRAEVSTIGQIQHVNLVRLLGFCGQGDERLLVYEYMQNGSLDHHLFRNSSEVLGWRERWQIAIGTARGLAYLHEECRECIIHCDIKPENILLDKDFRPKVADFGMAKLMGREISRVLTTTRGTVGYLAPEWISGLAITPKADVYSFGMVMFELISGRRNTTQKDGSSRISYFPIWAAKKIVQGEVLEVLDEKLRRNADVEELNRACRVACWCIQDKEDDRPSMGQVVSILEGILEVSIPSIPTSLELLASEDQDSSTSTQKPTSNPIGSG